MMVDLPQLSGKGASSTSCSVHAADKKDLLYRPERVVGERLIHPCHLGVMQRRNIARPREYFLVQFCPLAHGRELSVG